MPVTDRAPIGYLPIDGGHLGGRRNPYCSRCGNTRGGPYGHETSECTWKPTPPTSPTT